MSPVIERYQYNLLFLGAWGEILFYGEHAGTLRFVSEP
jgi:hypothetical protein